MTHANPTLPDPDDAPSAEDLVPADPPGDAPTGDDIGRKPAVAAPVPAHGEMASAEQLDEGARAVEMAGGRDMDTAGLSTGEADTGRPGQGGIGLGTEDETIGEPEQTAAALEAAGRSVKRR